MNDCLFCKIINGEIPANKVYEDDHAVVFTDINPKAPIHLLAIPKEHYSGVHEVPHDRMELFQHVFFAVNQAVRQEGLAEKGYRLVVNFGDSSGQAVPHIHIHILSGRELTWPPG
ncbi:MAG: HIT domain-containing protein [Chitinivibrionales bacterium]|nr:HIT domain-containing protein [Chitinivibrionales bacterium]MBD3395233.1 HIT domain-containing protein [Chitinivibrionales bacterium]